MCFERHHEGSLSSFVVSAPTSQNALVAFLLLFAAFLFAANVVQHGCRIIDSVLMHKVCHILAPVRSKGEG
jgi:hypothetical protein